MKTDGAGLTGLAQAYGDEAKARELLESWRWPNGPVCPHCQNAGEKTISKLEAQASGQCCVRNGVYFCGACRQQFTVTVGTVLERSHVLLSKWLMALSLLCSSKKSLNKATLSFADGHAERWSWRGINKEQSANAPVTANQAMDLARLQNAIGR